MNLPAIQPVVTAVRPAEIADTPWLMKFTAEFGRRAGIAEPDPASLEAIINRCLLEPQYIFLVATADGVPVGFIAGMMFGLVWNASHGICQEIGWWVEPEYRSQGFGLELLKEFESAAKDGGCKSVIMLAENHMDGDALAKVYSRNGYAMREKLFFKEL